MTKTRPYAELAAKIDADPVRRARMKQYKRAMEDALELGKLHAELGLPEVQDADELDEAHPTDSSATMADDPYVATLRAYVESLGGRLDINAVFPGRTLTLLPDRRWIVAERDEHPRSGTTMNQTGLANSSSAAAQVGAATPSRRRG